MRSENNRKMSTVNIKSVDNKVAYEKRNQSRDWLQLKNLERDSANSKFALMIKHPKFANVKFLDKRINKAI